jgi:hypothetical protein
MNNQSSTFKMPEPTLADNGIQYWEINGQMLTREQIQKVMSEMQPQVPNMEVVSPEGEQELAREQAAEAVIERGTEQVKPSQTQPSRTAPAPVQYEGSIFGDSMATSINPGNLNELLSFVMSNRGGKAQISSTFLAKNVEKRLQQLSQEAE